jgi:hypothetical protein
VAPGDRHLPKYTRPVAESKTSLEPRTSGNDRAQHDSDHYRMVEELEAAREEVLRLRDLLIGKDAELGQAKGRVAELEDQIERYTRFIDRLRLRRILAAVGRRLRGLGDQSP